MVLRILRYCVICVFYTFFCQFLLLFCCQTLKSLKGTELLISSPPFNGELPTNVIQALTLTACIRKVSGSNVGWHTYDLGLIRAFPQSSKTSSGITNLIYIRKRAFLCNFVPIYSYTCRTAFQRCVV